MANGTRSTYGRWLTDDEIEALEDFDLGALGRSLGPIQKGLGAALPGVIQGASTGAAAGPWGALIGGVAGGALSLATQRGGKHAGPPAAQPAPRAAPPAAPVPSEPVPPSAPAPAAPLPVVSGPGPTAAGQLAQLLQNPALQQAIGSLAAGQGGAGVAGVPVGAVLNLLGTLANNASYEAEAAGESATDAYLRDGQGRLLVDEASPTERAAIVWQRLAAPGDGGMEAQAPPSDDLAEWLVESGIAEYC